MKKFYFLILAGLLSSQIFASHIKGGEIYYDYTSGTTYDVYLLLYRDVTGIPLPSSTALNVAGHQTINSVTATAVSSKFSQLGCGASVEVKLYKATVNVGALPTAGITFSWAECCRTSAISNLSGVASSIYFDALMKPVAGTTVASSSPRFYSPANLAGIPSVSNAFNTAAFDPNPGDSIYVELVSARDNSTLNVTYATGFNYSNPFGTAPGISTTIDHATGAMSVQGASTGAFVVATRVSSYSNGVLSSSITRDAMYYLVSSSDPVPSTAISNMMTNGTVSSSANAYFVEIGSSDTVEFDVTGLVTSLDTLTLAGFGSALTNNSGNGGNCVGANCATFTPTGASFVNPVTSTGEFFFAPGNAGFPTGVDALFYNFAFESSTVGSCGTIRSSTVTVTVKVNQQMSIWANSSVNLCIGGSVQAFVSGDTTNLHWSPSTGVSDTTSASPFLFPTQNTTYMVTNLNDGQQITIDAIVDNIVAPNLSTTGTHAYIPNPSDYDGSVWYYNGVAIAVNADSVFMPAAGDYFAMVSNGACMAYSDTVVNLIPNQFPLNEGANSNTILVDGEGVYSIDFMLNNYANQLNSLTFILPDTIYGKTATQPTFEIKDAQNQVVASGVAMQLGDVVWEATAIGLTLQPGTTYQLTLNTDAGKVALFQPASFPYTEPNSVIAVQTASYSEGGNAMSDAFPFFVFGMQSSIGIEENSFDFAVYPVPMNDVLTVEVKGPAEFELMDISGRLLISQKIENKFDFNTTNLPQGVYVYKITKDNNVKTGKLYK